MTVTPADVPVVVLCGGMGTRIREVTESVPKPLVDIGGRPILWHIMKLYGHYGFRRFYLCLGYRGSDIKSYFLRWRENLQDFSITLSGDHRPRFHEGHSTDEDWEVSCIDTGLHSGTGTRLAQIRDHIDAPVFAVTYGDGIADVDLAAELEYHTSHGAIGTVTGVHPTSRYGELAVEGELVTDFREKSRSVAGYVNGGFFLFNRPFFDYLPPDDPDLFFERQPLQRLASEGELQLFRHHGFWMGMDTPREYNDLNALWEADTPPWRVWDHPR